MTRQAAMPAGSAAGRAFRISPGPAGPRLGPRPGPGLRRAGQGCRGGGLPSVAARLGRRAGGCLPRGRPALGLGRRGVFPACDRRCPEQNSPGAGALAFSLSPPPPPSLSPTGMTPADSVQRALQYDTDSTHLADHRSEWHRDHYHRQIDP